MANGILEMIIKQAADIINNEDNYETIVIGYTLKGKSRVFKNKSKRKKEIYKAYELCDFEPTTNIWFK